MVESYRCATQNELKKILTNNIYRLKVSVNLVSAELSFTRTSAYRHTGKVNFTLILLKHALCTKKRGQYKLGLKGLSAK